MRQVQILALLRGSVVARVPVVEIHCDRCKRVEHRSEAESSANPLEAVTFFATVRGHDEEPKISISYEDLCQPCERTVRGYLELISKKPEKLSPDRKKRKGKLKDVAKEEVEVLLPLQSTTRGVRSSDESKASTSRKVGPSS